MKFLIIGCNGMAGHVISIYMKEQGHIVVGYAREKSRFVHTVVGDAADFKLLKKTIWGGSYDAVINCVGILNQFAEKQHAPLFGRYYRRDNYTNYSYEYGLCVFRQERKIYGTSYS